VQGGKVLQSGVDPAEEGDGVVEQVVFDGIRGEVKDL
jgi:hypothetical protein